MSSIIDIVPVEYLQEMFECNFELGTVIWRNRPLHHFKSVAMQERANKKAGKRADSKNKKGYCKVSFLYEKEKFTLPVSHVVWKMAGREFVTGCILENKNKKRDDNALANLHLVNVKARNRQRWLQIAPDAPGSQEGGQQATCPAEVGSVLRQRTERD